MTPDKQHAHDLIEKLQDSQVAAVVRYLESVLGDPVALSLATAPLDDEPVTEEDRQRYQAGQARLLQPGNHGASMSEVLAEFDLR